MTNLSNLFKGVEEQQAALDRLERFKFDGGDGGGYDGRMEARVAKLETTTEYIQRDIKELKDDVRDARKDITGIRTTDFRIIFGAIIAVALGLAALMAKGFHWI